MQGPVPAQALCEPCVGRHGGTQHHVGVAREVLGDRVDDHVGAQRQRLLEKRGGEGVVHHDEGARGAPEGCAGLDVDDLEQGVGRRLQPQHRDRFGHEQVLDGAGVGHVDAHGPQPPLLGEGVREAVRGVVRGQRQDDETAGRYLGHRG